MKKPTQPPVSPVSTGSLSKEPFQNKSESIKTGADLKSDALLMKNTGSNSLTLEKWVDSVISPKKENTTHSNADLSRFGLKNDQDVIIFLKSTAGKSVMTSINEQQALKAAMREEQQFEMREHNMLMHRLKAFLFLWLMGKESHAADRINEINRLIQDKILHKNDPIKPATETSKAASYHYEGLLDAIANYEKVLNNLGEEQRLLKTDADALEQLLIELNEQGLELEVKHQIHRESLDEFKHIETNKVDEPDMLDRIEKLEVTKNDHAEKISQAIATNQPETAHLIHHHHGLNLKVAALKEILDIHRGLKCYTNEEGEQVTSFNQAHFILKAEQKIVKHESKCYLLEPGQDWSLINQEGKELALQHYEDNKHDLMCIKQKLTYNSGLEKTANQERVDDTKTRLEDNKGEQLLKQNQMNLVQSVLANAKNSLNQPQLNQDMSPRPTPTAGSAATPKPTQTAITLLFRQKILELRSAAEQDKPFTSKDLHNLTELAPEQDKAKLNVLLKNIPKMNSTAPVPFQTQQSFLKYIESFGVNATKPSITPIKAPGSKEEARSSLTPNPFKMTPSPFNKIS